MRRRSPSRLSRWLPSCATDQAQGAEFSSGLISLSVLNRSHWYQEQYIHKLELEQQHAGVATAMPPPAPLHQHTLQRTGTNSRWKARLLRCSSSANRCTSCNGMTSSCMLHGPGGKGWAGTGWREIAQST